METVLLIITLMSFVAAVAAGTLSWRVVRQERLRSDARIAALAAAIDENDGVEDELHPALKATPAVDVHGGLFSSVRPQSSGGRLAAGAVAGALVVATIVGALVLSSGDETARPPSAEMAADAVGANTPLELVALGHERESERLTVRGIVRGLSSTSDPRLTAVVQLFDREGAVIGRGHAPVGDPDRAPGGDRRFMVSVPAGTQVSRYRVSFLSHDHIVPHIDRRNPVI